MNAKDPRSSKRLQSFDDDDIVRYSLGFDIPIVGLVRNRDEYKEMREISLIFGYTLGMNRNRARAAAPANEEMASAPSSDAPSPDRQQAPGSPAMEALAPAEEADSAA